MKLYSNAQDYAIYTLNYYEEYYEDKCLELGEVQISLHKIVHIDWLRFCALRNKMDDERMGTCRREPGCQRRQLGSSSGSFRQFGFRRCYSDCVSQPDRDLFFKVLFFGPDRRYRVMFLACQASASSWLGLLVTTLDPSIQ